MDCIQCFCIIQLYKAKSGSYFTFYYLKRYKSKQVTRRYLKCEEIFNRSGQRNGPMPKEVIEVIKLK